MTPVAGAAVVFSASSGVGAVWGLRGGELYGDDECGGCGFDDGDSGGGGGGGLSAVGSAGTETGSFTAVLRVRTVTAVRAVEYVAAGLTVAWTSAGGGGG